MLNDEWRMFDDVGKTASGNVLHTIARIRSDSCTARHDNVRILKVNGRFALAAYRRKHLPPNKRSNVPSVHDIVSRSKPRNKQALCQSFAFCDVRCRPMDVVFIRQDVECEFVKTFRKLLSVDISEREADLVHRGGDQRVDEGVGVRKYLQKGTMIQLKKSEPRR
jgi:hypothetical protein